MVGGTRLTKSHMIASKPVIRVLAHEGAVARVRRGAVAPDRSRRPGRGRASHGGRGGL